MSRHGIVRRESYTADFGGEPSDAGTWTLRVTGNPFIEGLEIEYNVEEVDYGKNMGYGADIRVVLSDGGKQAGSTIVRVQVASAFVGSNANMGHLRVFDPFLRRGIGSKFFDIYKAVGAFVGGEMKGLVGSGEETKAFLIDNGIPPSSVIVSGGEAEWSASADEVMQNDSGMTVEES